MNEEEDNESGEDGDVVNLENYNASKKSPTKRGKPVREDD